MEDICNMNIYQKMQAITNEIGNVNKNLEVGYGKSKYKAVGEADVLKAVKEMENKYGIYSFPSKRTLIDKGILPTKKFNDDGIIISEGNQIFMRIETEYTFVNINNASEQIKIVSYGDGVDTQDKAPGKAMTYSDKYALLKAYKIVTGDDPDQEASPETSNIGNNIIDNMKIEALKKVVENKKMPAEMLQNGLAYYGYNKIEEIKERDYMKIYNAICA